MAYCSFFFKSIISLNHAAIVAGISFLLTALVSLIFAALAARPHITSNISAASDPEVIKRHLFFYGNYILLDFEKFKTTFDDMLETPGLIYENMMTDLYYLGKVLDKKFRLLRYSYSIFIAGLILTVASFLLALML